jgi:hypothetical protein
MDDDELAETQLLGKQTPSVDLKDNLTLLISSGEHIMWGDVINAKTNQGPAPFLNQKYHKKCIKLFMQQILGSEHIVEKGGYTTMLTDDQYALSSQKLLSLLFLTYSFVILATHTFLKRSPRNFE